MIKIYDRSVEISENERFIGFEGDNNVHTVCIEIFNKWLCDFDFKIDVMNKCKNIVEPEKEITEDGVLLAWDIKKEHLIGGILYAQVRAFSEDEQIWHSDIFELKTKKSINATKAFASPLPTEFEVIEKNITKAKNEAMAAAEKAEAAAESITGGQIIDESNLVHKTDDEEISGNKKFTGKVDINRIETEAGIGIYGGDAGISFGGNADSLYMRYGAEFSLDGDLKVNGKVVATKDDIKNLVKKDGDEEISGVKKFTDKIVTTEISSENEGLYIDGWDNTISIGTQSSLTLRGGSQINLVSSEVKIGDKYVATKEDITPIALREVSTHNADTNSHSDIRDRLNIVEAVAEGAGISETFSNYAEMVFALNEADKSKYKKGRNINIITVGVPDLWVAYVSDASVAYNYTTDEAFVEELKASGTIQVGYFKLAMLETQKVDLADYAKKEDITSALGGCVFKQVSREEYDAMFAEGTLLADVIYIVGGNANAS